MSDGSGDLEKAKISEEELKKKFEAEAQKRLKNCKDFVTDKTILIVRLNAEGTPQWLTSLQPAELNLLLDRMKFCILNPQPSMIEKPKGIIADLKGAFGKKRF